MQWQENYCVDVCHSTTPTHSHPGIVTIDEGEKVLPIVQLNVMSSSNGYSALPSMPSTSLSPTPEMMSNGEGGSGASHPLHRRASSSSSPSPAPASPSAFAAPRKKHNLTPAEIQARNLEKLLADPSRPAPIAKPPKTEKTLRPPREVMKNVSGSSAGAGSGDFHVYKHARRREYERIKLMEEAAEREKRAKEFEERQAQLQQEAQAKTSKNRAKRDKKKWAKQAALLAKRGGEKNVASDTKALGADHGVQGREEEESGASKRKRINADGAAQVVFQRPASDSGDDAEDT